MNKAETGKRSDAKTQRTVRLIRFLMKTAARQMVDMSDAIGKTETFDTEEGPVRALTYGFEDARIRPLLVNIHGSGFVMGSAAMDDPFMMQFVKNCGVKVISIDYPLSPEAKFPTALQQCYALLRFAKEHGKELGIDPDRIMLMGHSAGGNFCAAIGLLENEKNGLGLKGIILDYPPTDLSVDPYDKPRPRGCLPPGLCRVFDAAYCSPAERFSPLVSPALAGTDMVDHFPPTLIITAGRDSLAAETERFRDTLRKAGREVSHRRFENAVHGFTVITEKQGKRRPELYRQSLEAWKMMMEFVKQRI